MPINVQHLQAAFDSTVNLWIDPNYALPRPMNGPIELDWFNWFASRNNWKVARTLRGPDSTPPMPQAKPTALKIINGAFFGVDGRFLHDGPQCVDDVAIQIRSRGLTPRNGTPISLVSKIAAFGRPDIYPPWDRLARIGLRRRVARGAGFPYPGPGGDYVRYFANWYVAYGNVTPQIEGFVTDERWNEVLQQLGMEDEIPFRESFYKKIFDAVLMREGRREN